MTILFLQLDGSLKTPIIFLFRKLLKFVKLPSLYKINYSAMVKTIAQFEIRKNYFWHFPLLFFGRLQCGPDLAWVAVQRTSTYVRFAPPHSIVLRTSIFGAESGHKWYHVKKFSFWYGSAKLEALGPKFRRRKLLSTSIVTLISNWIRYIIFEYIFRIPNKCKI